MFWRKNKKQEVVANSENKVVKENDISLTFDQDKISQNQFLSNDDTFRKSLKKEDGKIFDAHGAPIQQFTGSTKQINMREDELAFDSVHKTLKMQTDVVEQDFKRLDKYLGTLSEKKDENIVIPTVKKRFFTTRNNNINTYPLRLNEDEKNIELQKYNIEDNQDRKYDSKINFNSLKNDQTKLLNLDEITDHTISKPVNNLVDDFKIPEKTKTKSLFTNRLFLNNQENTPQIPTINKKTTYQNFNSNSPFNSTEKSHIPSSPFDNHQKPSFTSRLSNDQPTVTSRTSTKALRFLTPINEDEEELRIKKENRRAIKYRE